MQVRAVEQTLLPRGIVYIRAPLELLLDAFATRTEERHSRQNNNGSAGGFMATISKTKHSVDQPLFTKLYRSFHQVTDIVIEVTSSLSLFLP